MTFENLKLNDIIYFVESFTNTIYEVTIKEIDTDHNRMLIYGVTQPISLFHSSNKGKCSITIPHEAMSADNYRNVFTTRNKTIKILAIKSLANHNRLKRKYRPF